jgi:hypothetical protein
MDSLAEAVRMLDLFASVGALRGLQCAVSDANMCERIVGMLDK